MGFIELIIQNYPRLLTGLLITVKITCISLLLATLLGLISCFFTISKNKLLSLLANAYIDIIRGTPLLVQAFFIYFGVPQLLGIRLSADVAGIITLSLNAGAYMSEIFRGGIQAIDKGQMEAARSLGLSYGTAMLKVILPQAVLIIIPALVNQFIITLKDTSILSVIGMRELTQTGKLIVAVNFESFKTWAIIGIMYLIVIYLLSWLSKRLEQKLVLSRKG